MSRDTALPSEIVEIQAADLWVDEEIQRKLVKARVTRLAEEMDLDSLGVVTVNRRKSGRMSLVDGQHRHATLRRLGMLDWSLRCQVYDGLTRSEEAALFRRLNDTRKPSAYDDFRAGLVAGDTECVEIRAAAHSVGLEIASYCGDGKITCVSSLQRLYRKAKGNSEGVLRDTLGTAVASWGLTAGAVEGKIFEGLGLVLLAHNGEIDKRSLVKKLNKYEGGPGGLLGHAKALRELKTGALFRHVADVVVDLYNSGRRAGRLE